MPELNFGKPHDKVGVDNEKNVVEARMQEQNMQGGNNLNGGGVGNSQFTDPNQIHVNIVDNQTPVVVLFGPPSCGKTMTMIRLVRYLRTQGCQVDPIDTFRPKADKHYANLCENFDSIVNSDYAAKSTAQINFMLVKVSYKGKPLCQILEAPGEHYFSPDAPQAPFPAYVNAIIASDNRKIWAIMVEPSGTNDKMDTGNCRSYAGKVASLVQNMERGDKVVFVYNKIDESGFEQRPGEVNEEQARIDIENRYDGIFTPFKNENPVTKLFKSYDCAFVPFKTGSFTKLVDGGFSFQQGNSVYPEKLWKVINGMLKGK